MGPNGSGFDGQESSTIMWRLQSTGILKGTLGQAFKRVPIPLIWERLEVVCDGKRMNAGFEGVEAAIAVKQSRTIQGEKYILGRMYRIRCTYRSFIANIRFITLSVSKATHWQNSK